MDSFVIIRLGKDSIRDIHRLDAANPRVPMTFTVHCTQVPEEAKAGSCALFCLGSDNNKGAPTGWVQGLRALGTITNKSGGPGYNDKWNVQVEVRVVLPQTVMRKDLLAKAPISYYWCSDIPVIGLKGTSNQTVQLIRHETQPTEDIRALLYAIKTASPGFQNNALTAYPTLAPYFAYEPPSPLAAPGAAPAPAGAQPGVNIILFGPPGTGKSHDAARITIGSPSLRVLFHPEYTYSDFIGLYRPVVGSDAVAQITGYDGGTRARPVCYFEFVPGPLLLALELAFRDPSRHMFLIVDEINRGDCAAIFGDTLQLLDRRPDGSSRYGISIRQEAAAFFRKAGVHWDIYGDGKLYFPSNFSILATMNTSDQSLYPMDSAFKRRWQWKSCSTSFDGVVQFLSNRKPELHDGKKRWDWIKIVDNLNKAILRVRLEDKQIGPWFLTPSEADAKIDPAAFANKCLFYLWHDVFKDDQISDASPFNTKAGIQTFWQLQEHFGSSGLAGIFKDGILEGAEMIAPASAAAPAQPEPPATAAPAAPAA